MDPLSALCGENHLVITSVARTWVRTGASTVLRTEWGMSPCVHRGHNKGLQVSILYHRHPTVKITNQMNHTVHTAVRKSGPPWRYAQCRAPGRQRILATTVLGNSPCAGLSSHQAKQ